MVASVMRTRELSRANPCDAISSTNQPFVAGYIGGSCSLTTGFSLISLEFTLNPLGLGVCQKKITWCRWVVSKKPILVL